MNQNHTAKILQKGGLIDQNISFKRAQYKALVRRPLTREEADFSEEQLALVWWFLNDRHLSEDDWFDIIIFRYLLAVKRWFTFPQLRQRSFATLAIAAMDAAVQIERSKNAAQPEIFSLDALLTESESQWEPLQAA